MDVYLLLNEQFHRCSKLISEKSNRADIARNLAFIMKNVNDRETHQTVLFQFIKKTIRNYLAIDKDWTRAAEFMKDALVEGFKTSKIAVDSEKIFLVYIEILNFVHTFGHKSKDTMEVTITLIDALQKVFVEKEHMLCNNMLSVIWKMAIQSTPIEASMLKELDDKCYKKLKDYSHSVCHHKTLMTTIKVLFSQFEKFQPTEDCFVRYHKLAYTFLYTLKNIRSEENVFSCCADVKRHEICKLISYVMSYGKLLAAGDKISMPVVDYLKYYIKYGFIISDEFKCQSKAKETNSHFNNLYRIMIKIFDNKSFGSPAVKLFTDNLKTLIIQLEKLEGTEKKSWIETLIQVGLLYYQLILNDKEILKALDKSSLKYISLGYSYLFILQNKMTEDNNNKVHQKTTMKIMHNLRHFAKQLNFSSATSCLKQCMNTSEVGEIENAKNLSLKDAMPLEFLALMRYGYENVEEVATLFEEMLDCDLSLFALCCNAVNDSILRKIDVKKFEDLNERLERYSTKNRDDDINVLIALALNHYYLFYIAEESLVKKIKETYIEKQMPACLNLQAELKLLNCLNKSLTYFDKILQRIKKNKDCISLITSEKTLMSILDNISIQYFVRGIEYKDIEAKTILWHLLQHFDKGDENQESQLKNIQTVVLDVAAFFLDSHNKMTDNSGNYVRVSKTLDPVKTEEVVRKSNAIVEVIGAKFDEVNDGVQVRVLNYLISLWIHSTINGRRADGMKALEKFQTLLKSSKIHENLLYHHTMQARIYLAMVDISLNSCKRNACNLMNEAIENIFKIRSVTAEFRNIFQHTLRNILSKVYNYSINRLLNLDDFLFTMTFFKENSITKGFFIQCLEACSALALWKLNMEKLDGVKVKINLI